MSDLKDAFDAEHAEAEERYCDAEIYPQTRWDQASYCEDDATVQGDDGGWYCPVHDPARWDDGPDPDQDRDDYRDWWDDSHLDDMGY
jgi:hypothetical protein